MGFRWSSIPSCDKDLVLREGTKFPPEAHLNDSKRDTRKMPVLTPENSAAEKRGLWEGVVQEPLSRALFCVFLCSEVIFSCKSHGNFFQKLPPPMQASSLSSLSFFLSFFLSFSLSLLHVCVKLSNTPRVAESSMTSSERPLSGTNSEERSVPSRAGGREFRRRSGSLICLDLLGWGHPSRTLEANSRIRSESVSGVLPVFSRHFSRNVPAVLGVWPIYCLV